uniref:DUF177 domain-containing protein n=1 Tax=Fagus sylvatica TaxID=28930 RepID=A0A2N9GDF1_FAGSY
MSLILPSASSVLPSYYYRLKSKGGASLNPCFPLVHYKVLWRIPEDKHTFFRSKLHRTLMSTPRDCKNTSNQLTEEKNVSFDWGDHGQGEIEEMGLPWEGAVVYKRNSSISHVEYCTTLERLGLGEHSTEISKSRASIMGLRVTKAVKDYPHGTPVQISIDITRKRQKLRLDGIIRTVITLGCNSLDSYAMFGWRGMRGSRGKGRGKDLRGLEGDHQFHMFGCFIDEITATPPNGCTWMCGEPAAECVFSNFSLLLTEEPIEEPEIISMGVIFGDGKVKFSSGSSEEGEEDDEASIDLEDRLYFPPEQKEIDISKNIRDMVHVEITINAICDSMCKGLCLNCGTNLNTGSCNCSKQKVKEKSHGPLGNLKNQMQQKNNVR